MSQANQDGQDTVQDTALVADITDQGTKSSNSITSSAEVQHTGFSKFKTWHSHLFLSAGHPSRPSPAQHAEHPLSSTQRAWLAGSQHPAPCCCRRA